MAKKTWIMWALFLLLPGAVGLSINFALKDAMDNRISESSRKGDQKSAAQEYFQMYEQWADLPGEQQADNPWGYGEYGGVEIRKRLEPGQSDRLVADLPSLDKGYIHYPDELADVIYGRGWQQQLDEYRHDRYVAETILMASIFLLAGGALILTGGLVRLLVQLVIKKKPKDDSALNDSIESDELMCESDESPLGSVISSESAENPTPGPLVPRPSQSKNEEEAGAGESDKGYFQSTQKTSQQESASSQGDSSTTLPTKPAAFKTGPSSKKKKDSYFGWAIDEDSTEFDALMTNEPLTKELTELTEEVSAIRQFAASQQDQMRKLQDGYDWMIIRRFCLRIIRCIDNIDSRIEHLNEQGSEAAGYLEDIRDELVFSLESGGIEQFKPDLNVSFKGLEKYTEAIRERIFTDQGELVGCIAQVTRPGYQYLVNDEDVKIVRCAQVKLYETNENK